MRLLKVFLTTDQTFSDLQMLKQFDIIKALLVHCRCGCPAVSLVHKLIAVFESLEKLPVYSYDLNGSGGYGLQVG